MKILFAILLLMFSVILKSENIKIIVNGQSNAEGQATLAQLPSYLTGNILKSYVYDGTSFNSLLNYTDYNNNQYPLREIDGTFGFEMSLCYDLINVQGYDTVFLTKYAIGSTFMYDTILSSRGTWSPNTSGNLYDSLIYHMNKAKTNLTQHHKVDKTIFIQYIGETDANYPFSSSNYLTSLNNFYSALSSDCGSFDQIIICRINQLIERNETYKQAVKTAQRTKGEEIGVCFDTDNLQLLDVVHNNGIANIDLGIRLSTLIGKSKTFNYIKQ